MLPLCPLSRSSLRCYLKKKNQLLQTEIMSRAVLLEDPSPVRKHKRHFNSVASEHHLSPKSWSVSPWLPLSIIQPILPNQLSKRRCNLRKLSTNLLVWYLHPPCIPEGELVQSNLIFGISFIGTSPFRNNSNTCCRCSSHSSYDLNQPKCRRWKL